MDKKIETPVCSGVYFVKNNENGLIKIGVSKNIKKRIQTLVNNFGPLTLIGYKKNWDRTQERMVHSYFKKERRFGEWFFQSKRLLRFAKSSI